MSFRTGLLLALILLLGQPTLVWAQGAAQVAAGASHTCAIDSDGQLWCWGRNESGALGLGDTRDRAFPNPVPGMTTVRAVATGDGLTCAIKNEGGLWCWGRNSAGQLGLGNQEDRDTPSPVDIPSTVLGVNIGYSGLTPHVCALTVPGIWCWGSGFLGQGPTSQSSAPLLVPGTTNASGLALGGAHTCIINADRAGQCWGINGNGQLGLGDTDTRTTPATVPGMANVEQVVVGFQHSCARTASGTLWCWGRHASGQLGLGGVSAAARPDRLDPTEVTTLTLVNQLAAGQNHS